MVQTTINNFSIPCADIIPKPQQNFKIAVARIDQPDFKLKMTFTIDTSFKKNLD